MFEKIGLFSDNFYKFLTSLSLLVFIYCASFPVLFLDSYNENTLKNHKEWLTAFTRYHFFRGMKYSLFRKLGQDTSLKERYSYYYNSDTNFTYRYYENEEKIYQYFYPSDFDSSKREIVDSLNVVSKEEFEAKHTAQFLEGHQIAATKNINAREWISKVLGIISILTFALGMYYWNRYKNEIDKTNISDLRRSRETGKPARSILKRLRRRKYVR